MQLTVVGCSGSFPGPDGPASCYLVEADGFRVVLDLGNGALGYLQRHCSIAELDTILVSHLHPDHVIDLLALYVARTYDPDRSYPVLPVRAPAGAGAHLSRAYGRSDDAALTSVFEFSDWGAGSHAVGPLTVTAARMAHPVEAWGMRIEHDGRSLVYSGDTGPCEALVELARDADLLLCEASYQEGRDNAPDIHLTGRQAGEVAARAGVARLLLTHVPPWFDPAGALAEARTTYGGQVGLATTGTSYDI